MDNLILVTLLLNVISSTVCIKIFPDTPELTITSKGDLTLECEDDKPIKWVHPTYETQEHEKPEDASEIIIREVYESGRHKSLLILRKAYYLDTGEYTCLPSDETYENESANIYLYVHDNEHLLALDSNFIILTQNQFGDVIIPCRPTAPDVNVTLTTDTNEPIINVSYNPKIGFTMSNPSVKDSGLVTCISTRNNSQPQTVQMVLNISPQENHVAIPYISTTNNNHFVIGGTVELNCSVRGHPGVTLFLTWNLPDDNLYKDQRIEIGEQTLQKFTENGSVCMNHYRTITIRNASIFDQGTYECVAKDLNNNMEKASYSLNVFTPDKTFLNMSLHGEMQDLLVKANTSSIQWVVDINAYPRATIKWTNQLNIEIPKGTAASNKYTVAYDGKLTKLIIRNIDIYDTGIYTIHAANEHHSRSLNITLLVEDKPTIRLFKDEDYYRVGKRYKIECSVTGYPLPTISWFSKTCNKYPNCEESDFTILPINNYYEEAFNQFQLKSIYELSVENSLILECRAENHYGEANESDTFLATDVDHGFSVWYPGQIVVGDENLTIGCAASRYTYAGNLTWSYSDSTPVSNVTGFRVERRETIFSYQEVIVIDKASKKNNGEYICSARRLANPSTEYKIVDIKVNDLKIPTLKPESNMNGTIWKIGTGQQLEWSCYVYGVPPPSITWYKNGTPLQIPENETRIELLENNQTLLIKFAALGDDGEYTCRAENRVGNLTAFNTIFLTDKPEEHEHFGFIALCLSLAIVCVVCMIWLCVRIHKETTLKKELAETGLLNFEQGAVGSLNPELGVEDQADLLPYDKRWEFPRDKLKFGKQLGSGAFGVVMKAEANGIIDENVTTIVAVKLVKRGADPLYIKALASELKIMIHLGKHLNVVNLLGACTRDISKRELVVIVEYCRYGNLHDFLLKQRDNFINQIDPVTGRIDSSISSITKNNHYDEPPIDILQNGFNSGNTEETPIGSDGYLISKDTEPDWRSNYRGDYRNTTVHPIKTIDLVCWSFQVARGMEYLASRKVLHGDLAARNILLADDNIVKICDFGLAKSMYSSEIYERRKHDLLPIRWMALESIRDRVFSTQSDIWSFGISLWELFSLSVTPYPGIEHLEVLYTKLVDGFRMEKPAYANDEIYEIMLDCWRTRPAQRPNFSELSDRLGSLLEEGVRSHYTNLNEMYLRMNSEMNNNVDYLALLNPPVHNSIDSEPRYVNIPLRETAEVQDEIELKPMLRPAENNYVNVGRQTGFMNPAYGDINRIKKSSYESDP